MKKFHLLPLLFLSSLTLTGCDDDDLPVNSDSVSNTNIFAEITVTSADNKDAVVETRLRDGAASSNFIRLVDGDRLVATTLTDINSTHYQDNLFGNIEGLADVYKEMTEGRNFTFTYYGIQFTVPTAFWYSSTFADIDNNATFLIELQRPSHSNISNSTVTLPGAFDITSPIASNGTLFSRGTDNIIVNWTTPDTVTLTEVRAITRCNDGTVDQSWATTITPDTGTYTIPATTLVATGISGLCSTSINVQRINTGAISSGFGQGGTINGRQSRSVVINTTD